MRTPTNKVLTTPEKVDRLKMQLKILEAELDEFLRGEWSHEYYMTIGYNKVFTGKKIYKER